ncbi:diphosphomevalonate decarboxylase [Lactobacillus helveticus]|uniref:diphosphomevalonate decarboxylase n=1 Tax=Lactobacillus helveticus TaxID=1587 RepID=UPI002182369D|nr:diphosphomevalonate decarboxylase [Lactobacillus helveticus]MCT0197511.1 diphosphomevalonate decarboxylase [Lactobacillus helveticus]
MSKIVRAHTNIALIKYWGKANAELRLPLMSSLSMTLDAFYTDTSVEKTNDENAFYLNGQKQDSKQSQRVFSYLTKLQNKFGYHDNLIVKSVNHVPTSAGLASSSSAFAALAAAFCQYYNIQVDKKELSRLARIGSGSACRSIFGGFSVWQKGDSDASSYAYALDEHPQMDLHLLAVELNTNQKKISSTSGMKEAQSSPFFNPWLERNETELNQMIAAIKNDDFTAFGELAELNANEMHAINLTAQPEFTYFEPNTIRAIKLVEDLRKEGIECYYTIDAGPNIKILCRLRNSKEIIERFKSAFNNVNIVIANFGPGITYLD